MQYVEDDMDDLFRRAAENYPLKIVTKDWEDVCPVAPAALPLITAVKKKQYPLALLLTFVFLTIGFALTILINLPFAIENRATILKSKLQVTPKKITINTPQLIPGVLVNADKNTLHPLNARWQIQNNNKVTLRKEMPLYSSIIAGNNKAANKDETSAGSLTESKPLVYSMEFIRYRSSQPVITINEKNIPPAMTATALQTAVKRKNNATGLYFKMEAGVQSNQVQSQGFGRSGISAGLFAGFRLNRHASVETGIGWSKKYFFTDARHFDMSKAGSGMPSNMTLISLNSKSNIFEIPVSFRYLIHQNNKAALSIVSGISSFIYSRESNDYLALVNGQQQILKGKYTNHKSYFSAAVQFGVGYEYYLNKRTHVNFEPYIQVPLKGIGVGQVQLMTAGLHIGITRYLHH